jgi:Double zinc ribbon
VFPPQCPFCAHTNPADARFCNECGAPLHLRPCNRCEAVNNQVDENCYKCGMALSMPCTAHEAAPVWPALDTVAASASLGDLCFESGHAPLNESVTEGQDVRLRQSGDETAAAPLHDLGAATGPRPLSRLALSVVLSIALLTTVGVSAYYAYRHQTQLVGPLSAAPANPALPTDVTAPPVNQGVTRATASDRDDGQMLTASESDTATTPQRISTTDQAAPSGQPATEAAEVAKAPSATAPAQQSATQAAEVAKAPSATAAVAAEPRHKPLRTGAKRPIATHSAANPSASTNQDAAAAAPVQKKAKAKRKPVRRE